jgi:quinol monooxygenase YgiN
MTDLRKEHGWVGHEIYRDATDPNLITIVNHMRDLDGAKRYGGSAALREGMARAGVLTAPEIVFCEDAEAKKY